MRLCYLYLLLFCLLTISDNTDASIIFINEIHYDNNGADTNEFIELAGQAGTDLTDWSLLLYNGSNGKSYRTIDLTGILTNDHNGFGFQSYTAVGIQNGAPDGIALIDNHNSIRQFISYEGSFIATDGAANGMLSQQIALSENSETPDDFSLQLTGLGRNYQDFVWHANVATKGDINAKQEFIQVTQVDEPETVLLMLSCLLLIILRKYKVQLPDTMALGNIIATQA